MMYHLVIFVFGIISIIIVTFPIGYKVTKLFPVLARQGESFFLSLGLGFVLTIGLWSFLITLGVPVKWYLFIGVNLLIAFIPQRVLGRVKTIRGSTEPRSWSLSFKYFLPVCGLLIFTAYIVQIHKGLFWHVPPSQDVMTQGYVAMLMKTQGDYPIFYPFLDNSQIIVHYPPGFSSFAAILSIITTISLEKVCLILYFYCILLYVISMYFLGYTLSGSKYVGIATGLLSLHRGLFNVYSEGQATEIMALVATSLFLLCFLHSITQSSRWLAVLAGFCFGTSGLIHFRFFVWSGMAMGLYVVTIWLGRGKIRFRDYRQIAIALLAGIGLCFPWIWAKKQLIASQGSSNDWDALITIPKGFSRFHTPYLLILLCIGILILLVKRRKIDVIPFTWLLMIALLIEHWALIQIIDPSLVQFRDAIPHYFDDPIFRIIDVATHLRVKQEYLTFLSGNLADANTNLWYGLVMIIPLVASYSLHPIVDFWNKNFSLYNALKVSIETALLALYWLVVFSLLLYGRYYIYIMILVFLFPIIFKILDILKFPRKVNLKFEVLVKAVVLMLLALFVWNEQQGNEQQYGLKYRLGKWINCDYEALNWFKYNTSYEDTLVLNQPAISLSPVNWESMWAPVVSERKSIFFKLALGQGTFHLKLDRERARWAYYNITNQDAYRFFIDNKITHIFIPSYSSVQGYLGLSEQYESSPYVEKVFEAGDESRFARIYRILKKGEQHF